MSTITKLLGWLTIGLIISTSFYFIGGSFQDNSTEVFAAAPSTSLQFSSTTDDLETFDESQNTTLRMDPCSNPFSDINFSVSALVQCGDPGVATFSADVGEHTDITVEFEMPAGFTFSGGVSGALVNSTSPLVSFTPEIINQRIEFSFAFQASCDATDSEIFDFLINYNGDGSNCSYTSLFLIVDGVVVSIAPEGTPGRNTESTLISVLNQSDTLTSTIVQEGIGAIDTVFFYIEDHPLLTNTSIIDCNTGTPLVFAKTIGNRHYYTVDNTSFGSDGFVRNEGIDICHVYRVDNCPDGEIPLLLYGVVTSCADDPEIDICSDSQYSATLDFESRFPQIEDRIDSSIDYDPTCFDGTPLRQQWILTNTGEAPASNITITLNGSGGSTPFDITSIEYSIAGGAILADAMTSNLVTGNFPSCVADTYSNIDDLASRLNITFSDVDLQVGEEIIFSYDVYPTPCGCSECDMPRRLGANISDYTVEDLCGVITQDGSISGNAAWPNFDAEISSFMESPVTNCAGSTSTLSTTVSNYQNSYLNNEGLGSRGDSERNEIYFDNNGGCNDCFTQITFAIPNGLDYVAGSAVWTDEDGTVWAPTTVDYVDNDGGIDFLILIWEGQEPEDFDVFNEDSGIFFDYTPDCDSELAPGDGCGPALYNDVITKTVAWSTGDCGECTPEVIECPQSLPVTIKCPGILDDCQCDGFVHVYTEARRENLYQPDPDNDGLPDDGSDYDLNLLRTDRFLKGDSIRVDMGGYVSANAGQLSSFDYIYAEVEFENTEFLPLGGEVTIFDNDGGTYSCSVITQQIDGNTLITDLSIPRLMANGCSAPPSYSNLDSIALTFWYTPTEQFTGDLQQLTHTTRMFASDEPYGGVEYSCRPPLDYRLSQIGTQTSFDYFNRGLNGFEACQSGSAYYRGYSRIGSTSLDYFPGEYINDVEFVTSFETNIPSGMVFNYMRISIRRKNAGGTNDLGGNTLAHPVDAINISLPHPALTQVGNMLFFDMQAFLTAEGINNGDYPPSDEGYSWSIEPYFIGTCNLEIGPLDNTQMSASHITNENLFCSAGYIFTDTLTNISYSGGAEIVVEAIDECISVESSPSCSRIRIRNLASAPADNAWLSFETGTGAFILSSLNRITGGANEPLDGGDYNMFDLGTLSPNANEVYELCVYANICEEDSLRVFTGYDCLNTPTLLEEALCSDSDIITFKPIKGNLFMVAKAPDGDVVIDDLCDTITYVVDINAAGPGFLSNITLDLNLPPDLDFLPGTFEIAYPTTATPASIPPDSEFAPASDPEYLYGNTFQFDVSGNDPILSSIGLIGSAGSATNENVVNVRFDVVTKCGFGSGSRVLFESNATEGCGDALTPIERDYSGRILVEDAPPPFASEINIAADTLNACDMEQSIIEVNYAINGGETTTSEDSIRVILPAGISYVDGSYIQGGNPSSDPPVQTNSSGLEIVYWGIEGLAPGSDVDFSFSIQASDIGQLCKDYPITVQTFKSGVSYCDATMENCNVRSISDESVANIFIDKANLQIQPDNSTLTSMIVDDQEMLTFCLEVENEGQVSSGAATQLIVDVYQDTNGDGRVDDSDSLLGELVFEVELTPGESVVLCDTLFVPIGSSCGLLTHLDTDKNCSCETSSSLRMNADLDLKLPEDLFVCSNDELQIGLDNASFDYQWFSIAGSDLSAISPNTTTSPATFSYDNNTGTTIVWEYGLAALSEPGCYSVDTITIHIYPENDAILETNVCGPVADCGDGGTGFSLSGPITGSDYNWTSNNGTIIDDTSDPLSTVSSGISETTIFNLSYIDENGCPTNFMQTVNTLDCACTALGDTVWYDLNVNGLQDLTEPGIPGITVYLYTNTNLTTPIQTTTTNADGYYAFLPLPQGSYVVRFDTLGNTAPYHQLVPTVQDAAGSDEDDSDADVNTGFTGSYFIPNGISDWTVDAGFHPAFDLALIKEINTDISPGPYLPGDVVTYDITVTNQGGYYAAQNIEIVDYIPLDLTYVSGTSGVVTSVNGNPVNITNNGGGSFILDELLPLDEITLSIALQISSSFISGPIVNYAEISSFENEFDLDDVDSTPDSDDSNDSGGEPDSDADNYVDGDGTGAVGDGTETTDEDDHDPALVEVPIVDLALQKRFNEDFNPSPIAIGEMLKFDIIVRNQGDIAVDSVRVVDYVPAGFSFDHTLPLNAAQGWNSAGEATIKNTILPGSRDTVCIYLEALLSMNPADYINFSEIIAAYDTITGRDIAPFDIDSEPDSNSPEEMATVPDGPGDDNISSSGRDETGSEDDHDPETVDVVFADLALTKIVDPDFDLSNITYGDSVKFLISVVNQGTMIADSVEVVDYLPDGLSFDPSIPGNDIWEVESPDMVSTWIEDLYPTAVKQACIWLRLEEATSDNSYLNVAEISTFIDNDGVDRSDEDIDSQLDNDPNNNAGGSADSGSDNVVDGDGSGSPGDDDAATDEDNSDPANLSILDLAHKKEVVTEGPYTYGDTVRFELIVFNQGTEAAQNIEISDWVPSGFSFPSDINPDSDGSNPYVVTIPTLLSHGESDTVYIDLILQQATTGAEGFINYSEITGSEDEDGNDNTDEDIDSESDNDPNNEDNVEDNETDGDGDGEDEDDHDLEEIEVFDLALTKTTTWEGPTSYGDTVPFDITVYNQGNVEAYAIEVSEYVPCGFLFDENLNPTWSYDAATSLATMILPDPIAPDNSDVLTIQLVVQTCDGNATDDWTNIAEISSAEDENGNNPEDADSDPDDDPDNDGDSVNDIVDNEDGDEDDHDPEVVEVFDLALLKTVVTEAPFAYGDLVEFKITLINQGNMNAANIEITDHLPVGFSFDSADNAGWDDSTAPAYTYAVPGTLNAGDTLCIPFFATLEMTTGSADSYSNISEVSDATDEDGNEVEDADSTPDDDPDNDGEPNDDQTDDPDDEDDHDPATVPVFDLALTKTTAWTDPITYGDVIPFDLNIINQGNVDAYNVEIVEYIPCGYLFQSADNPLWTFDASSNTATTAVPGPVAAGGSYTATIQLLVQPCDGDPSTNWVNTAEITGGENEDGEEQSDIDSTPDTDPDNDGGGEVDGPTDDVVDNSDGDEDDHDPEMPNIFDLALTKGLAVGQSEPVSLGDVVTFTVTVYNQGNIVATNVEISEYIPAGYCLSTTDSNGWTDADMNGVYTAIIPGPIAPNTSATIDIALEVKQAMSAEDYVNEAEISGSMDGDGNDTTDDDIDSTADDNMHNDGGGDVGSEDDDEINENGEDGNDEDDHDPATVDVQFYDLALTKALAPGQPQQFMPGDDVTFKLTVINQGTIDAYNVTLAEYIPADMTLSANDTNGWTDVDGILENTIAGPIEAYGGMDMIEITLTISETVSTPTMLVNWGEISGGEDENGDPQDDTDSTPDDDPDNDVYGDDNQTDGDGTDDEDDHDPSEIMVDDEGVFDLALNKVLDPDTQTPVYVGDEVTYFINVCNQGNITAQNIELTDIMGASLKVSNNDPNGWADSDNDGAYEYVLAGPLLPGDCVRVPMLVEVVAAPTDASDLSNTVEISAAEDENGDNPEDIDSTPDMDPDNDNQDEDDNDELEEDGKDGGDEDDHDWEDIPFGSFDLALIKQVAADQPMPIMPGDDVTFVFTVFNQGTVDAYNIDIVEYTPAGMSLSAGDFNGWTDVDGDGNYENTIAGLNAGESIDIEIVLTIDAGASGSLTNYGEISDAEDEYGNHPEDDDSTPDDDPNNDTEGDDNQTDGDGTDDEDDHDPETIDLGSWDLALTKQLADGQTAYVMAGDDVSFVIEVINQGTMSAYNVDIVEYVPSDMSLSTTDTNGWTDVNLDGVLENTIAGPIMPGDRAQVEIILTIDAGFTGSSLVNAAEISDFEDEDGNHPDDNDSTSDDDPNNDPFGDDNQEDGDGTDDEDDHDPEEVFLTDEEVFDLALEKYLDPDTELPVYPGDDLVFVIQVTNEGNTTVQNVDVVDYLSVGLTLSSADTNGWVDSDADGYPENTIPGPLAPGEQVELYIVVTIDEDFTGTELENRSEISEFEDEDGNPQDDEDSTPDDDPDNDPEEEDDEDGDIVPISNFDLALIKTLAPGQTGPFVPGMDVTFRMEVHNQGTVDAYNVVVDEYLPSGMTLSTADTNGWADIDGDGNLENTIAGPITPGNYDFVDITVTIDPNIVPPTSLDNAAEISEAEDEDGNQPDDSDSDPDSDPDNDTRGDDDDLDGDGTDDEDDEDGEQIDLFTPVFDLALKKLVTPGQELPVRIGDDISFDIWVYNQGNVPATNIEVTEHMPACMKISTADANGWTDFDNDGIYEQTIAGPLAAGDSTMVSIIITLECMDNALDMVNVAEISGADDMNGDPADDIDSDPDQDPDNDTGGNPNDETNDETDDDGTVDEDDHDPEYLPIWDVALQKTTDEVGPVQVGDIVTFTIEVTNEGNQDAYNVGVTDHIPAGYIFHIGDPNGWTFVNTSTVTNVIPFIEKGTSQFIEVQLEVAPGADLSNLKNTAEVNDLEDEDGDHPQDWDSDEDNDDGDQGEDDEDDATPPVFDLSLVKQVFVDEPAIFGDTVRYEIVVCNQGNITSNGFELTDYSPQGLLFLDDLNPGWSISGSNFVFDCDAVLKPDDCKSIELYLEIGPLTVPGEVINYAEISNAENDGRSSEGGDIDSTEDDDNTNDAGGEPDGPTDNQTDGDGRDDEDDHDPARFLLVICHDFVCLEQVNLSLDELCSAPFTADMLLPYIPNPNSIYNVEITDALGNVVDNMFDSSDIGNCFMVSVSFTDLVVPFCGANSCWGQVCIEDKFEPTIECEDITLSCTGLLEYDGPTAMDNCGNPITLTQLSESVEKLDCDEDAIKIITQTWVAIDKSGNRSEECTQTITIERFSPTVFTGVDDVTFSCSDDVDIDDLEMTGVISYDGVDLVPGDIAECSIFVNYTDQPINSTRCEQQILRTWRVVEWRCNTDVPLYTDTQIISIIDDEGPVTDAVLHDRTATTTGYTCNASFSVPVVNFTDACNEVEKVQLSWCTVDENGMEAPAGTVLDFDPQNPGTINLPVGNIRVKYTAFDACHNQSEESFMVAVSDQTSPVALCERQTIVSVTGSQNTVVLASVLDDGSFDDCGSVKSMQVRKMLPDACGLGQDTTFADQVEFCCADVDDSPIMVIFRVTDESGNTNDCMVEVVLQNKTAPTLVCPPNITVSCEFPFDSNDFSVFGSIADSQSDREDILIDAGFLIAIEGDGKDGFISSGCVADSIVEESVLDLNQCGLGTLTRIFSASGDYGTVMCSQTITFDPSDALSGDDIDFPDDYEGDDVCDPNSATPMNLPVGFDEPVFPDNACGLVGAAITEELVLDNSNGSQACFKILRTWTVIDWCQDNPDRPGFPMEWSDEQVIKITNTNPPRIIRPAPGPLGDPTQVVESFDPECGPAEVELTAIAFDDCTSRADLVWSYEVDAFSDGTVDITGQGNDATAEYPVGDHMITWTVTDGCGNSDTDTRAFSVVNVKAPTPYCISLLTVDLIGMDTDGDGVADAGMAEIWANDFVPEEVDFEVCGPGEVVISFTPDDVENEDNQFLIFDCDDLDDSPIALNVYYTIVRPDGTEAQSFCTVMLVLEDNVSNTDGFQCDPSPAMGQISGTIWNAQTLDDSPENQTGVMDTEVSIEGSDYLPEMTSVEGSYDFGMMPTGEDYMIKPSKSDNPMNGVSTLDLVLIQKHILGIDLLTDPYDILAADINKSGTVTASDLVALRKLILGVSTDLPNSESWRFVVDEHEFVQTQNPWLTKLPEIAEILNLTGDRAEDFIGYKVGDVTGDAVADASLIDERLEVRSQSQITLVTTDQSYEAGDRVEVRLRLDESISSCYGVQLSMEHAGLALAQAKSTTLAGFTGANVGLNVAEGVSTLSWHTDRGIRGESGTELIVLSFVAERSGQLSEVLQLSSAITSNELYQGDAYEISELELNVEQGVAQDNAIQSLELEQNVPNPWKDATQVAFTLPESGEVQLRVMSVLGKLLYEQTAYYSAGEHVIELERAQINASGVMMLELSHRDQTKTIRMLAMD